MKGEEMKRHDDDARERRDDGEANRVVRRSPGLGMPIRITAAAAA